MMRNPFSPQRAVVMARVALVAVLVSATVCASAAQPATAEAAPESPPGVGIKVSFRPSVAIVVAIFTMIFSLTFLLLMYAKFCHTSSSPAPLPATLATAAVAAAPHGHEAAADGVPKPVIDSLPFFRFATLRGARQGMECAVCLARFDDADLLRLLPRCRHAFHLDCVDQWLESSASCPLCRARVDADDATLGLKYAASARIVFGGGDDDASTLHGSGRDLLDIFVERVPSSRFPAGGSPRKEEEKEEQQLDRHRHRIIVSDVVFKSRWSELNSADLIALDTEMLRSMSSGRFYFPSPNNKLSSAAEEEEDAAVTAIREDKLLLGSKQQQQDTSSSKASAARLSSGVRSVSEIVSLPRLRAAARERMADEDNRRWLPIARRTARWFAGRANHKQGEEEEEGGVHVV